MKWLVLIHVLGAAIWVGGHLILSLAWLPMALRTKSTGPILEFEKYYERVGIPAFLLQVVTGLWMASRYIPVDDWLAMHSPHHRLLWIKFGLLLGTVLLAVHARWMVLPQVRRGKLSSVALHILATTLLAVTFVITGLSFRFTY
ncbi:MAG: CopD family protein [Cyclobacteriaceae bacterium]|jgi:putative copper export protein|nr:CopD family protein [Cyclobacteriaceae bacterium]